MHHCPQAQQKYIPHTCIDGDPSETPRVAISFPTSYSMESASSLRDEDGRGPRALRRGLLLLAPLLADLGARVQSIVKEKKSSCAEVDLGVEVAVAPVVVALEVAAA